jgi:hypothetical protein
MYLFAQIPRSFLCVRACLFVYFCFPSAFPHSVRIISNNVDKVDCFLIGCDTVPMFRRNMEAARYFRNLFPKLHGVTSQRKAISSFLLACISPERKEYASPATGFDLVSLSPLEFSARSV